MEFSQEMLTAYSSALAALYQTGDRESRVAALASAIQPLFSNCDVTLEAGDECVREPNAGGRGYGIARSNGYVVSIPGSSVRLRLSCEGRLSAHERFLAGELRVHVAAALVAPVEPAAGASKQASLDAAVVRGLGLTTREGEVLYWIMHGRRDAEIAQSIGAALRTVNKHVENILRKLGVETRLAAARVAAERMQTG